MLPPRRPPPLWHADNLLVGAGAEGGPDLRGEIVGCLLAGRGRDGGDLEGAEQQRWDRYWQAVDGSGAAVPKPLAEELARALARLAPRMLPQPAPPLPALPAPLAGAAATGSADVATASVPV